MQNLSENRSELPSMNPGLEDEQALESEGLEVNDVSVRNHDELIELINQTTAVFVMDELRQLLLSNLNQHTLDIQSLYRAIQASTDNLGLLEARLKRIEKNYPENNEATIKKQLLGLINPGQSSLAKLSFVSPMNRKSKSQGDYSSTKKIKIEEKVIEHIQALAKTSFFRTELSQLDADNNLPAEALMNSTRMLHLSLDNLKEILSGYIEFMSQQDSWSDSFGSSGKLQAMNAVKQFYFTNYDYTRQKIHGKEDTLLLLNAVLSISEAFNAIAFYAQNDQKNDISIRKETMAVIEKQMKELIRQDSGLFGPDYSIVVMMGTLLKVLGFVLLSLTMLSAIFSITGLLPSAFVLSLATQVSSSVIVSQAIHSLMALMSILGIGMSENAASIFLVSVIAGGLTALGYGLETSVAPSQLLLEKNQAANTILNFASSMKAN